MIFIFGRIDLVDVEMNEVVDEESLSLLLLIFYEFKFGRFETIANALAAN